MADRKQFIINHMNNDHQDSLVLYLRVYCRVAASDARSAHLDDVKLDQLLLSANGNRYSVPLQPPMASLADTRARVVALHHECLAALGLSDVQIKVYQPPQGVIQSAVFLVCLATYIAFSRRGNFLPGSFLYETLSSAFSPSSTRVEQFMDFCYTIQPILITLMLGIHIAESALLAARLRRHRVPLFSRVWWAWEISCMIEGYGCFQRTAALTASKN
ncbi:hypothetical protein ASPZODRAFT_1769791 [Penicilliopsis zonata CBS 506.65]|uniref:DUF2470 domain-containing protein n=1 Tax=Penicilliopsis zonata CBS 506.65 TaxID=1073090 RepID=A0A1L9SKL7_9EURO|nr:hypothetical protein ASPZODRAFT_1769791 [Penicilliopsis zonata CBS 506.65]OJJ47750.1 hypothetical protein ASPZODRAFT_1769791 [Penicilliopsis zonata CBS 506.65]